MVTSGERLPILADLAARAGVDPEFMRRAMFGVELYALIAMQHGYDADNGYSRGVVQELLQARQELEKERARKAKLAAKARRRKAVPRD